MNRLQKILNELAAKAAKAQEEGRCWVCEHPAKPRIHSEAGSREYQISGTCEECFDRLFEEEDDNDPTPWCHVCGAMEKSGCHCLPIARNH